jgi:hypothetical protein
VVVPEDRPLLLSRHGEVGTSTAQIASGGDGGVVGVVGIGHAVAVAIETVGLPRGGDELHRAYRAVPHRVPVQLTVVSVGDGGHAG